MTAVKISAGSVFAILAAQLLGLQYASSAGIITLLSIMNTRRETIEMAGKRCIAFLVAVLLSNGIFLLLGYRVWCYGVFLLMFFLAVSVLQVKEGFSMSAVLVTHLLGGGSFSLSRIRNEAELFAVGVVMGILINSYMPDRREYIQGLQREIEERMRELLREAACALRGGGTEDFKEHIKENQVKLASLEKEAIAHAGNTFGQEALYFVRYAEMRTRQNELLKDMVKQLERLTRVTPQGLLMADFFEETGNTFRETNNAEELLKKLGILKGKYRRGELPVGRAEFENRAILFHILQMMEYFLKLKKAFAENMTNEEKRRFWEK